MVWELAQRVLSAVTEIEANLRAHNTRRTKWGAELINAPDPVNLEDVIEAVRSAGAVVVPVDEATCRQALQDQVLLEGPGSRKQGVKTGAAEQCVAALDCPSQWRHLRRTRYSHGRRRGREQGEFLPQDS